MSVPCSPDVLMFRLYLKEFGVDEALKLADHYDLELYDDEKTELVNDFLHPSKRRPFRTKAQAA